MPPIQLHKCGWCSNEEPLHLMGAVDIQLLDPSDPDYGAWITAYMCSKHNPYLFNIEAQFQPYGD